MNFEKDSVKTCEFLQIAKFQLTDILYTPVQKKTPKFQQNIFGTRNFIVDRDVSMTFTCNGLMTVPINNFKVTLKQNCFWLLKETRKF